MTDRIEQLEEDVAFWKKLAEDRLTRIQDLTEKIQETVKWLRLYIPNLEQMRLNMQGDIDYLTEDWK